MARRYASGRVMGSPYGDSVGCMKPLAAIVFIAACGSSRIMSDASVDAPDARRAGKLVAYIGGYAPTIAWADVSRSSGTLTLS